MAKVMTSHRIPEPLKDRLKLYAAATPLTQDDIMEAALTEYLDKHDPTGKVVETARQRAATAGSAEDTTRRLDALEKNIGLLLERIPAPAANRPEKKRRRA